MRLELGLGYGGGISALQTALARFPGAQFYARYDDEYGDGGLYYADGAIESFTDVTSSPPAGEPTSAGMLVDGSDGPTLVQGRGPNLLTDSDPFTANGTNSGVTYPTAGRVRLTKVSTDALGARMDASVSTVIGQTYRLEGFLRDRTTGNSFNSFLNIGTSFGASDLYNQNLGEALVAHDAEFVATTTTTYITYVISSLTVVSDYAEFDIPTFESVLPFIGCTDADEMTLPIEWNANGVTGDRVVWEGRKDANNRIVLHFVSGILRLESFVAGTSEGYVAYPGVDDGGSHSALLYWDEVTGTLSLNVDGQGLEGPELVTNGAFDADVSSWAASNATALWDAGRIKVEATASSGNEAAQNVATVVGVVHQVAAALEADAGNAVADSARVRVTTGSTDLQVAGNGSEQALSGVFEAVANPTSVRLSAASTNAWGDVGDIAYFDNVSVKATYIRTGLTLPTNLTEFHLGHSDGSNQLNGNVLELVAASGDHRTAWN